MKKALWILLLVFATDVSAKQNPPATLSVEPEIKWQWPIAGKIVSTDFKTKGITIAGEAGQPVKAAAAGEVVYIGNDLRGYKNLIVIKHSGSFISAYANNDHIKVKERAKVKAGETISTLDSTGTLHFSMRHRQQNVDPTLYLLRVESDLQNFKKKRPLVSFSESRFPTRHRRVGRNG